MKKRTRRKLILLVVLLVLLALLGAWYANFRATKSLRLNIATTTDEAVIPPDYLYSMAGSDTTSTAIQRPLGVYADEQYAWVTDSAGGQMFQFEVDGTFVKTFGADNLTTPMYVKRHPKNGRLYVSDRRERRMVIFEPDGKYVGIFDPKLPKDQLPKGFDTRGDVWMPVALDFAPDGTMYVTDFLPGSRLLIFGPDGKFKRSIGKAGVALRVQDNPENFQFPNGVAVNGQEVWVTDSNNRRIQVFDLEGNFQYVVPTQGLPRGVDFLVPRSKDATSSDKLVVIDTLSHDGTIWSTEGGRLATFGSRGVLGGQFNFPNDVSINAKNLVFITDTANARVQVWGWPTDIGIIPPIRIPKYWYFCFTPLLLLPLLLLARKRRFTVTRDFIDEMVAAEQVKLMPQRKRKWIVTEMLYDELKEEVYEDIEMKELLHAEEYSESDVNAMMEKYDVDFDSAVILTMAQRSKLFCTEDVELTRLAKTLEVDVVEHIEFIERFTDKKAKDDSEVADKDA
ncbi:MAG: hypothetical protein Q8K99_04965 [Actinomycetota bacterium]|nr:hypothetical protein [Actinomycetota bacterium]